MKNTEEQQLIQNLNEQIEALHGIVNTYKEYVQLQDKQIQGLESCLAITTDLNEKSMKLANKAIRVGRNLIYR